MAEKIIQNIVTTIEKAASAVQKRVVCLYRVSTLGQVDKDDIPMQKQGPGRIRVSFKTVQGSVSWDTCYTPCGMCPAFNYTSITYPC